MRKVIIPILITVMVGLDQFVKHCIAQNFQLGETKEAIKGIFSLTYLRNYGAAFSILQNQKWLFTVITIVIVGAAIYYLIKEINSNLWLISSLVLIIAGGLGNFIDRLRLGYVVDMIDLDFMDFAIFNIADSFLTVGVFVLFIAFWKEEKNGSNR